MSINNLSPDNSVYVRTHFDITNTPGVLLPSSCFATSPNTAILQKRILPETAPSPNEQDAKLFCSAYMV